MPFRISTGGNPLSPEWKFEPVEGTTTCYISEHGKPVFAVEIARQGEELLYPTNTGLQL
jgi:hypothetical protein